MFLRLDSFETGDNFGLIWLPTAPVPSVWYPQRFYRNRIYWFSTVLFKMIPHINKCLDEIYFLFGAILVFGLSGI